MESINTKNIYINEGLVEDSNPNWIGILQNPRINELFEGIKNAQRDIDNGEEGKDFDEFFKEFDKKHLNGKLFQT